MKYTIQQNIGKVKYLVNFSDGTKKHKDGSEFWDIATFKSKLPTHGRADGMGFVKS